MSIPPPPRESPGKPWGGTGGSRITLGFHKTFSGVRHVGKKEEFIITNLDFYP